jgi:hypothetical protein
MIFPADDGIRANRRSPAARLVKMQVSGLNGRIPRPQHFQKPGGVGFT